MARLLDRELNNGGDYERRFSSGEFLEKLYNAIVEPNAAVHRVNAESYVFASMHHALDLGIGLFTLIDAEMIPQLEQTRNSIPAHHQAQLADSIREFKENAETQHNTIEVLKASLVQAHQNEFTDQVESGIVALSELVTCAKSIQQQLAASKDRHEEDVHKIRSRNQNRWMIFWAAIGAIIATLALLVSLTSISGKDVISVLLKFLQSLVHSAL